MAYASGNAASFADLKSAIETLLTANGWTLTSGVLSKSGCFFKLTAGTATGSLAYLLLEAGTGQSGSTLTGACPQSVKMSAAMNLAISFPVVYEIDVFSNPDEVYVRINHNSSYYQQLSWGKSAFSGIGGTGAWLTGAWRGGQDLNSAGASKAYVGMNETNYGFTPYQGYAGGLFAEQNAGSYFASFFHTGLDGDGWIVDNSQNNATGYKRPGTEPVAFLLCSLPSLMNEAAVLLPIHLTKHRASYGQTPIGILNNARYLRIDNHNPGAIITYGSEQWKVYPFLKKESAARNGVPWNTGADHTGTFGYAIRYTG